MIGYVLCLQGLYELVKYSDSGQSRLLATGNEHPAPSIVGEMGLIIQQPCCGLTVCAAKDILDKCMRCDTPRFSSESRWGHLAKMDTFQVNLRMVDFTTWADELDVWVIFL